jgi:hypothetical protein
MPWRAAMRSISCTRFGVMRPLPREKGSCGIAKKEIRVRFGPDEESVGLERKAVVGFAHRFRPTYAGANVGHPYGPLGPAKGLRGRPWVSHISRKKSEMRGTQRLWRG